MAGPMNVTALAVFVVLFGFVTLLGFMAARWRQGGAPGLAEWSLGGRRFGTLITWFLLGGDLYTAYTFIAVPALVFGQGAIGFYAVPYTIFVYPLLLAVFPKLWSVAHAKGYVTAADFVRGRFGSPSLALAVAVTGIAATMPYIALQLVGIEVVLGSLGVHGHWPLLVAFVILAGFTYMSGLRAPAIIALVKDVLIYITVIAAIIIIPRELGGYAKIFAHVPAQNLLLAQPSANNLGAGAGYATLAIGSALALFLYPHAVTGLLSSSSRHVVRRNAVILPAYSLALGFIGLLGYMALAAGVKAMPAYASGFARFGPNYAVPALFLQSFPSWFVGVAFAAIAIGALVPAAGREVRVSGGEAGRAALCALSAADLRHPAAIAGRHLDHPDLACGPDRPLYALAPSPGTSVRLDGGIGRRHGDGGGQGVCKFDLRTENRGPHDPLLRCGQFARSQSCDRGRT